MAKREISLDVLRGLAILGMVLSGTISRNPDLPAWLFHAQIPPPSFAFDPNLPGITWVDLVFPFFLFAMGMAFPFSLNKLCDAGVARKQIIGKIVLRSLKLFFFAVMLGHLSPFHYPESLGWIRHMMGLLAFFGFFMAFSRFPHLARYEKKLNAGGYIFLAGLLLIRTQVFDLSFSIHSNDIIILVLANMALFGAILWLFTRQNWYLRLGILVLYFALRLTHNIDDSWNKLLWDFRPLALPAGFFPGLYDSLLSIGIDLKRTVFYNPDFLKYLMIVIPGTIAGDLVLAARGENSRIQNKNNRAEKAGLAILLVLNLALNLWGLMGRHLNFVLLMNLISFVAIYGLFRMSGLHGLRKTRMVLLWSIFWMLLGLVFEAWEGGIKKDHATLAYFFFTAGLSGFMILFFQIAEPLFRAEKALGFIGLTGKNPLLGYIAASYCIMPVLYFAGLLPWMDQWHLHWSWAGVLRGLILTGLMVLLTVLSVHKKYFWKT